MKPKHNTEAENHIMQRTEKLRQVSFGILQRIKNSEIVATKIEMHCARFI